MPDTKTDEKLTDWAQAQANYHAVMRQFAETEARRDAIKVAIARSRNQDDENRISDALKEASEPFMEMAHRRPHRIAAELEDAEEAVKKMRPEVVAAKEAFGAAKRRETRRIASGLQPRHRAAVTAMVEAVESLSKAISDERAVRAELAKLAPEPVSDKLPDIGGDLMIGSFSDFGSPAWRFRRRVRDLQILED